MAIRISAKIHHSEDSGSSTPDLPRGLDKVQRSHRSVGGKSIRNSRPALHGLKIQSPLTRSSPSLHRPIAEAALPVKEHHRFGRRGRIHSSPQYPLPLRLAIP